MIDCSGAGSCNGGELLTLKSHSIVDALWGPAQLLASRRSATKAEEFVLGGLLVGSGCFGALLRRA